MAGQRFHYLTATKGNLKANLPNCSFQQKAAVCREVFAEICGFERDRDRVKWHEKQENKESDPKKERKFGAKMEKK